MGWYVFFTLLILLAATATAASFPVQTNSEDLNITLDTDTLSSNSGDFNLTFGGANITLYAINVTLNAPANANTVFYKNRPFTFNFTVSDNAGGTNFSCDLYLNSTLNQSITAANDTITNFNPVNLSRADHAWYTECNSTASDTWIVTVNNTLPVNLSFAAPTDGQVFLGPNGTSVDVQFLATDEDGDSLTYWLYINSTLNASYTTNQTFVFNQGVYNIFFKADDGFGNSTSPNITFTIRDANLSLALQSGVTFTFLPTIGNESGVNLTGQNSTLSGLVAINNEASFNTTLQLSINFVGYYIQRLLEPFTGSIDWYVNDQWRTNSTYNWSVNCMSLNTGEFSGFNISNVQEYEKGRITYSFDTSRTFQYYNGSDWLNQTWNPNCPTTNYIGYNLTARNLSKNMSDYTLINISYYPYQNSSDTLILSALDTSGAQVNSTAVTVSNQSWKQVSVNITTLNTTGIDEVRVYLVNGTATEIKNGFVFLDNLVAYNASSFNTGLTFKAGCNSTYSQASTLSVLPTYTSMCNVNASSNRSIWLWTDYNFPRFGLNYDIYYQGVSS